MDSALILSLMDTAVKVTPSKPFDSFSGFRFLATQVMIIITTRRVTTPPIPPAMATVLDLPEVSVLGFMVVKAA